MFKPLNKLLIAKRIELETLDKALLILPVDAEDKDNTYEVINVADNVQGIKRGDKIVVSKHDVTERKILGKRIYIINCDRVIGVLE